MQTGQRYANTRLLGAALGGLQGKPDDIVKVK